MRRLVALFVVLSPLPLSAESVRFARTPDVSPGGTTVVFSYLGDLWTMDVASGQTRHLTMHEKHDINPVFSPDGKQVAFSSNRHGQYDVFVISVEGGKPRRLTFDSADDHPTGWSPDGQSILFSSSRGSDYPSRVEIYSVPAQGGMERKLSIYEGREAHYSPKGDAIAYVRGPGHWYRKGYRGTSNDDIWLCDPDGTRSRRLTSFAGQDTSPMWSADGKALYYVSEFYGNPANIVRQDLADDLRGAGAAPPQVVTRHTSDSIRRARISADGKFIVYECGFDLCLLSTADHQSRKLDIDIRADDKTNLDKITTFTSGITDYALTNDEKNIAFVVHGEIFLTGRTGGKAKRLTTHPAYDHGLAWSPDSKKLLFLSDRDGNEDIYSLESDDPDHPDLLQAHKHKAVRVTNTPEAELGVQFAPDGKRVGFLRAGKLLTMNPDGSGEKLLVPGSVIDFEWSPDSQWICYARTDASFASDLYIIPASGATAQNPPRNITRYATTNAGITWSKTGNRIAFISNRKKTMNAYVLSLHKPAAPGVPAAKEFDWEHIHNRVVQPTFMPATECAISNDGSKIAFRADKDGQEDLWVADVTGSQITRITTGNMKPRQIRWSRQYSTQVYFRDGAGNLRTASVTPPASPTAVTSAIVPFTARMLVRQEEVFTEVFDQSWRALADNFYDPKFHGTDWKAVRERYRPIVKHVGLREDLYALITLMFGELNASHLGISGKEAAPEQVTADLGLLFNHAWRGPGLKIAEIVRGGPADRRGIKLAPGDLIVAIDGVDLNESANVPQLLNDKVGEMVAVSVAPADNPNNTRRLELNAVSRTVLAPLLYERWVERNAQRVTELSQGKLGYIHIPSMDEKGVDRFLRALYSDNFDKEGIVLDVRYNGGGFTHETILNYLLGKDHTTFQPRHGPGGLVLNSGDRKWTKPLVLLINNRSYSDAEIFPHAFRYHGLGKLVGQTTGGFVIGTRSIDLIDGSKFRTPRIGVFTNKGVNMEKEGVRPDEEVDITPDQHAEGLDPQLDRAVQILRQDVAAWKKDRAKPAASGTGD
jgi:tricorn protease